MWKFEVLPLPLCIQSSRQIYFFLHLHSPKGLASKWGAWTIMKCLHYVMVYYLLHVLVNFLLCVSSLQVILYSFSLTYSLRITLPCWGGTPSNEVHSWKGKINLETIYPIPTFLMEETASDGHVWGLRRKGLLRMAQLSSVVAEGRHHFSLELQHALWWGYFQGLA